MTLFSAFHSVNKADIVAGKNPKPSFDPSIGMFAILNLAANFVNLIFGGQKEKDHHGLEKFNDIIADEVNRYLPQDAQKDIADGTHKLSYMNDKELAEHEKSQGLLGRLRQNSVKLGEVGLRTLGSLAMVFNYKKIIPAIGEAWRGNFKQAFFTSLVQDKNTFRAGCGMVAGKIMGLLAQTDDPNNPPKGYISYLRQKVFWITSSFTEMIAQTSVAIDRHNNKRLILNGKDYYDVTGVVGNALLTVPPYPTRLVLPYGEKVLDVNEVQARLLSKMSELPPDKISGVAARVTARMVEHMGEKSPSFSQLYTQLMDKLCTFHDINILPHCTEPVPATPSPAKADTAQKSIPSGKRAVAAGAIKNLINREHEPEAQVLQI